MPLARWDIAGPSSGKQGGRSMNVQLDSAERAAQEARERVLAEG